MVQSATESVIVTKSASELTVGLDRYSGFPGDISILGSLYKAGTIVVIPGATVNLYVNGQYTGSVITNSSGRYLFEATVEEGSYTIYTQWAGNDTYLGDTSPSVTGTYAKIQAAITISVSPSSGAPPVTTRTTGLLTTVGGSPLGGKTVHHYRNGVKINSQTTKTTSPGQGAYDFSDIINASADYYVVFEGDDQYAGCEVEESISLPCTICGHMLARAVLGAEVECESCHSVFETVIV